MKQTQRPTEQNWESRNKSMHTYMVKYYLTREPGINGEKTVFSVSGPKKIGYLHVKQQNLNTILHHSQKMNLKWTKHLNEWSETTKFLEDNREKTPWCCSWQRYFGYATKHKQQKKSTKKTILNYKTSTQQHKRSTKRKGNLWNERRYLQTTDVNVINT